jgi:hypothetical protein
MIFTEKSQNRVVTKQLIVLVLSSDSGSGPEGKLKSELFVFLFMKF